MDSEDSRDASSDGESADSPPRPARSDPRDDGPDSPDDNSEVNYNFRPASPDYARKNQSEGESDASRSSSPQQDRQPNDRWSPKSDSRSRPDSPASDKAHVENSMQDHQRRSPSASSRSSRASSTRQQTKYDENPPTEEISDGEMDSEHDERKNAKVHGEKSKKSTNENNSPEGNLNMSHEDLSDVSDLDSVGQASEEDCKQRKKSPIHAPDLSDSQESHSKLVEHHVNGNNHKEKSVSPTPASGILIAEQSKFEKLTLEKTNKPDDADAEEQLDFEAEEGECLETPIKPSKCTDSNLNKNVEKPKDEDEGSGAASSLEEGEVSDDDERRPEETEPRPVCRFYSRGQCTWGVSCRFLHPGVTDKGNYTMFDMVRSMPAGYGQHHQIGHVNAHMPPMGASNHAIPASRIEPPVAESAWERGLRTAKEMLRKACKRKEQDTDFEEKKMHLTLGGAGGARGGSLGPGGEEDDADLAAYAGYPPPDSPPIIKREREEYLKISERRYEDVGRLYGARERSARYPERIPRLSPSPHRTIVYDDKLDDRAAVGPKARRGRTTREVIVQRAPGGPGRGDEWADPWMRGGGTGGNRSPARRKSLEKGAPRRRRKYSSGSSYSSSSSSHSSSHSSNSSARSGSIGRKGKRKAASPTKFKRASPSVIVQERRAANARAVAMNPPAPSSRKRAPSPAATRQHAANPPPPQNTKSIVDEFGRTKPVKPKQRQKKLYSKSSSSGSDSSSSSSDSDSDSHSSSSSDNSGVRKSKLSAAAGRGGVILDKKSTTAKTVTGNKLLSPKYASMNVNQKKEVENESRKDAPALKKRPATSPVSDAVPAKKPVSRREELLKQLKAVEDAIARKRSKV